MPQAPDPSVQLLKNNVLLGLNPFNVRRGQVILRIVAPKSRESSVLFVQDCKIIAQLQLVVDGDGSVSPICRFVVGQRFALQDAALTIFSPRVAPVNIGKRVLQRGVLIEIVVVRDGVSRPLGVEVSGNRLQHVSHGQLVGVRRRFRLHAPLFHHPKFQGRRPRGKAENRCDITAANGIFNIALRTVFPAFEPHLIGHPRTIAEYIGRGHYHFTSLA